MLFDLFRLSRVLIPLLQPSDEPWFGRGSEESNGCGGANDGVEIDAGPHAKGGWKCEEDEGRGGEAEGRLCGEVREDIVVDFIACGTLSVGAQEKGTDVAAEVW